jgi:hypothetical protein
MAEFLAWLGDLDIEVAKPLPFVCLRGQVVAPSADGEMLRKLMDYELSGVFSKGELGQKFSRVGGMLHDVVLRDRAIIWRTTPVAAGPLGLDARCHRSGSVFLIPSIIDYRCEGYEVCCKSVHGLYMVPKL